MSRLDDDQLERALTGSAWRREQDTIVREYKLADFAAALALVNRVGALAEQADHHPDIHLYGYNRVRLVLCTHSAGGLTEADLALAGRIDALS